MKLNKFNDQVFLVTVLIENLTDNEFGTGFFVVKPVDEKTNKILLFSNKHVFWGKKDKNNPDAEKKIRVTLHTSKDADFTPGSVHPFEGVLKRKEAGYYDHPDSEVDVACANISSVVDQKLGVKITGMNTENFCKFEKTSIYAGMNVVFVGYPSGFYDRKHSLPIMRSGIISSLPMVNFEGKPQLLIDAQVFPGSSGSPVFVTVDGQWRLLGIISEAVFKRLNEVETIKTAEGQAQKIVKIPVECMGLGLLFDVETIMEIYDLA